MVNTVAVLSRSGGDDSSRSGPRFLLLWSSRGLSCRAGRAGGSAPDDL